MAADPHVVYGEARALAEAVRDFCERDARPEWDGGNLGYAIGSLHAQAVDFLDLLGGRRDDSNTERKP